MKITILTLFPEMFDGFMSNSIIKRAISKKVVEIKIVDIRDYTKDRYHRVDSAPVGGGAGLIMKCQPIVDSINANKEKNSHIIMLSPRGKAYKQERARELSKMDNIILLCGHYEGIDERVNKYVDVNGRPRLPMPADRQIRTGPSRPAWLLVSRPYKRGWLR